MIYAYGILRNGYYIIFCQRQNISYGKAVYHIAKGDISLKDTEGQGVNITKEGTPMSENYYRSFFF